MTVDSEVTCGKGRLRRLVAITAAGSLLWGGSVVTAAAASAAGPATPPGTAAQAIVAQASAIPPASAIGGIAAAPKKWATELSFNRRSVTKGGSVTAKVSLRIAGKGATAKVALQVKKGKTWRTYQTVTVKRGSGSYTFKPTATAQYRTAYAKLRSGTVTVKVTAAKPAPKPVPKPVPKPAPVKPPATFTIKGSGYGHGVGMAQYGAYYLALQGRSVESILATYYTGAKVSSRAVTGDTRVQLSQTSGADVYVAGGRVKVSGTGLTTAVYPAGSTIGLRAASGGRIDVWRGKTKLGTLPAGKRLSVMWEGTRDFAGTAKALAYVRKAGSTASATHGYYRYGRFEISSIAGKVNVVNVLKTNTEYLYGLGEMPSSWGKGKGSAALQAQAVAARNFALINSSLKSSCGCNVYDDTRSQYFSGYAKEAATGGSYWRAAVDATVSGSNGKVMTVGGALVQAYYYSASGGGTLNSEDVWVAKLPYLRSVSDPYSLKAPGNSNVSWKATVSQAKVKALFPKLKDVVTLTVSAKYPGGAVKTLRAVDSRGVAATYTAKSDTIRNKLGLKAAWITGISRG